MENVMTRAWEIATEGKEKFGGRKIEYIAEALKQAWSEFKMEGEKRQPELSDQLKDKLYIKDMEIVSFGSNRQRHWLAEIKGSHPKYHFDREFITPFKGGNDDWGEYKLEENKMYEMCFSTKYNQRYYFMIVDGIAIEYTKQEVLELVN